MEIWDAYNKDESLAGFDLIRDEKIPQGFYHLVSEVLVKHVDGSYLLMQRSHDKKGDPGKFEATARGSVLKGETSLEGAKRELKEETGLVSKAMTEIYTIVSDEYQTIFKGYFVEVNCDKNSIQLQVFETSDFLWLPQKDFLKFIETDAYIPEHSHRLEYYLKTIR